MDYQRAYCLLSHTITDAINTLVNNNEEKLPLLPSEVKQAIVILQTGQQKAKDMYIEAGETDADEE